MLIPIYQQKTPDFVLILIYNLRVDIFAVGLVIYACADKVIQIIAPKISITAGQNLPYSNI